MKTLLQAIMLVLLLSCLHYSQTTYTAAANNGNWNTSTTWSPEGVPGIGDDVIIPLGDTVIIDGVTTSCNNLTIDGGLKLISSATASWVVTIAGDLTVSGYFKNNLGTSVEPNLYCAGDLTLNNGATFDMGSSSTKGIVFNFNKQTAGNQTITINGTPALYQFNKINVNRAAASDIVYNAFDLTVKGGNNALHIINGIWEQAAGTLFFYSATSANWYMSDANGTLYLSGSGSASITSSIVGAGGSNGFAGTIKLNTTGSLNVGTNNGQARLQVNGSLILISGTINVNGRFTVATSSIPGTVTMTGGVINVNPQGPSLTPLASTSNTFEVSSGGIFNMSDGTITVKNPIQATGTGLDVKFSTTASYSITGGTINIGDGVSTTTGADGFQVSTHTVPLYNLNLNTPTGAGRQVTFTDASAARNLVLKNDLTITSGSIVNSNFGAGSNITLGGAVSNSGTFNQSTTSTYTLNGTSPQTTEWIPSTVGSLNLSNASGITISNPVTVTGTLTLGGNGSYTNLNNVTGYTGLTYAGTAAQNTGSELPASIANLTINNVNGVTLNSSPTITTLLNLNSGLLKLNDQILTIGASAFIGGNAPSETNMIVADYANCELRKEFTANPGTNFIFPIGDNTGTAEYSPVYLNTLTADAYSSAYIGVRVVNSKHLNNTSSSNYLSRYWVASASGITNPNYSIIFNYVPADVSGDEASIYGGKYSGGTWSLLGQADPITHSFSAGNQTSFSDFSGGSVDVMPVELNAFNAKLNLNKIDLLWSTASESNNHGFYVERKTEGSEWENLGFVKGNGNSNVQHNYNFEDKNIKYNTSISYRLRQVDISGAVNYSKTVDVKAELPKEYSLYQNYPNPFNPATTISYSIPTAGVVTLEVFNSIGESVSSLVNKYQEAGNYSFSFDASRLNSGIYFYKLNSNNYSSVKKMILIK